jgi:hypothetical protein
MQFLLKKLPAKSWSSVHARMYRRHWRRAAIALLLVGCVAVVFWQQLAGLCVFIGESDRLNSYLNIRLAEYDALRAYGRVTTWDPSMFGGFSLAALHWMNPGNDPVSWLLQFFDRQDVYQVLGYVSILSVLAACVTAYLYIRDVVGRGLAAATGAVCYGLSVFSIHRMAQVDNAHLTVVLLPLGMLVIRRIELGRCLVPFLGLCATLAALAYWGFLQEVAYAYCFLGLYALYRAAVAVRRGWLEALAPIVVFGLAAGIALLFAAPRLFTLASEFYQLTRTTSLNYYGYTEFVRFFHEGIYGRYFEEGRLLGHGMNLHEGLQLVSSTMLALFVCLGILRPSRRIEGFAALIFLAMLLALRPIHSLGVLAGGRASVPTLSIASYFVMLCAMAALVIRCEPYLRIRAGLRKLVPQMPRPTDTSFHLFALVITLGLILTLEGYYAVYTLFARADFTHTRLSVLIILPMCTLFSIYLAELKHMPLWESAPRFDPDRGARVLAGIAIAAALTAWIVHGPLVDYLVPLGAFKLQPYDHNPALPAALIKVLLTAGVLAALLTWLLYRPVKTLDRRVVLGIVIAAFAITESVVYAHFKVADAHTWTYPVPFRAFNYMNVPPSVLRPPTPERLAKLADRLEVENYRSILVNAPSAYVGAKSSHIAEFWHARMIGGYGTGVPKRLADLPWPEKTQTLRTVELTSIRDVDPMLLALLNVKYIIVLTPDLYFDVPSTGAAHPGNILTLDGFPQAGEIAAVDGVTFGVIRNPMEPLPRHFLVGTVTGVAEEPQLITRAGDRPPEGKPAINDVGRLRRHSLAENFPGTKTFDTSGTLGVTYRGDRIDVRVSASDKERFLVINERYHPKWRAYIGRSEIAVLPTNAVMMGVEIPSGVEEVQLRFMPFSARGTSKLLSLLAVAALLASIAGLRLFDANALRIARSWPHPSLWVREPLLRDLTRFRTASND